MRSLQVEHQHSIAGSTSRVLNRWTTKKETPNSRENTAFSGVPSAPEPECWRQWWRGKCWASHTPWSRLPPEQLPYQTRNPPCASHRAPVSERGHRSDLRLKQTVRIITETQMYIYDAHSDAHHIRFLLQGCEVSIRKNRNEVLKNIR